MEVKWRRRCKVLWKSWSFSIFVALLVATSFKSAIAESRYFGFVPRRHIVGEALPVVISLDIFNGYRPRWKRSFTRLP